MSRAAAALASILPRPAAKSAAECAGLPRLRTVTVKEIADAAGLSVPTVRARCLLWELRPRDPRALPYIRGLGRPFQIRHEDAVRFLSVERVEA